MSFNRRHFILTTGAAACLATATGGVAAQGKDPMFGLIGKFKAKEGSGDTLAKILLDGVGGMPGCLSYVVAKDPADSDTLWITEVWDSKASHEASLKLPSVQEAIKQGRPLIDGMEMIATTEPVGGHGLS